MTRSIHPISSCTFRFRELFNIEKPIEPLAGTFPLVDLSTTTPYKAAKSGEFDVVGKASYNVTSYECDDAIRKDGMTLLYFNKSAALRNQLKTLNPKELESFMKEHDVQFLTLSGKSVVAIVKL